jgi:hypothetical protein
MEIIDTATSVLTPNRVYVLVQSDVYKLFSFDALDLAWKEEFVFPLFSSSSDARLFVSKDTSTGEIETVLAGLDFHHTRRGTMFVFGSILVESSDFGTTFYKAWTSTSGANITRLESGLDSGYVFLTDSFEVYHGILSLDDIIPVLTIAADSATSVSSIFYSDSDFSELYVLSTQIVDSKLTITRSLVDLSAAIGLNNLVQEV